MGACRKFRLSKIESTGRDSNPRSRFTGAVSSPLDDQCSANVECRNPNVEFLDSFVILISSFVIFPSGTTGT